MVDYFTWTEALTAPTEPTALAAATTVSAPPEPHPTRHRPRLARTSRPAPRRRPSA